MGAVEIELRDVRKVYHKDRIEIPVLEGLNLTVTAGEFVVLMGPSGSGKSTLLHLIGGLDSPTSGSILVGDAQLEQMRERELTSWRSRSFSARSRIRSFQLLAACPRVNVNAACASATAWTIAERA